MRRVVFLVGVAGLVVASVNAGCESDGSVAEPQNYGGGAGAAGQDAGGGSGDAGAGGSSSGGWGPAGGSTPGGAGGDAQAGSAGAETGGAAGTGTGGDAGTGTGGAAGSGTGGDAGTGQGGSGGPCAFPDGVPQDGFIGAATSYQDTDPTVDGDVNAVMASLSGCSAGSDCTITGFAGTTVDEICQSWFGAVAQALRDQGYCAGQHEAGYTDEIAVSSTGCTGRWYGYHICNYGGGKVVWNPGARRGWWMIDPGYCPP